MINQNYNRYYKRILCNSEKYIEVCVDRIMQTVNATIITNGRLYPRIITDEPISDYTPEEYAETLINA